jgi:hypothetical protein
MKKEQQIVECMQGHSFDKKDFKACPICGSIIIKKRSCGRK